MTSPKETNINNLSTLQILWHLVYRHRVILLITSNVATLLIWFMQQAPTILK
jgi:hypothetical protein